MSIIIDYISCIHQLLHIILQAIWKGILQFDEIEDATDFFKSGAGSMDVTR